jgi:hypothetical protein
VATPRELLEAYSFERRRLLTALVSGAAGGRDVEPPRPGRIIVGGVALGVLLMAGAAVNGVLTGRTAVDLNNPGPITSKDNGSGVVSPGAVRCLAASPIPRLAEDRGFEPLRACTQPAFQASAIGH